MSSCCLLIFVGDNEKHMFFLQAQTRVFVSEKQPWLDIGLK